MCHLWEIAIYSLYISCFLNLLIWIQVYIDNIFNQQNNLQFSIENIIGIYITTNTLIIPVGIYMVWLYDTDPKCILYIQNFYDCVQMNLS